MNVKNICLAIIIFAIICLGVLWVGGGGVMTDGENTVMIKYPKKHTTIETNINQKLYTFTLEKEVQQETPPTINQTANVNVAVATLWTDPDTDRAMDALSISNPVDMWQWTENMTNSDKKDLVGSLQTQALYGDVVTILAFMDDWAKVAVHGQPTPENDVGYVAWMPTGQLVYETEFNHAAGGNPFIVVTAPTAWLYSDEEMQETFMEISYNTRLPIMMQVGGKLLVTTPSDGEKWISVDDVARYEKNENMTKATGDMLVEDAQQFLGLPYLWAGTSGFGFDCSGFTFSLFKVNGITIPRDSSEQFTRGTEIEKADLQKGNG